MIRKYRFIDSLGETEGSGWRFGWFILPLLFLFLGGDVLRNIREMPLVGWLVLVAIEMFIYLWLYWRYKRECKQ
jgi:hypothetical protein